MLINFLSSLMSANVVDRLIRETLSNHDSNGPPEHLMLNNSTTKDKNLDVVKY